MTIGRSSPSPKVSGPRGRRTRLPAHPIARRLPTAVECRTGQDTRWRNWLSDAGPPRNGERPRNQSEA
jgi:hypothetical protein